MQRILIIIVTALLAACSTTQVSERVPATSGIKPRHVIFLVHGLAGSDKSFGDMPEILPTHLAMADEGYVYEAVTVAYNTGSNEFSAYDFSLVLGSKIRDHFQGRPLGPEDKISIVAHSQGGVISYIWYLNSVSGGDDNYRPFEAYAKRVDAIVTLGTPFWGSTLAFAGKNYRDLIGLAGVDLSTKLKMGVQELREMSFLSDTINRFRQRAIAFDKSDNRLGLKFRPLNIAGIFPNSTSPKFTRKWKRPWTSERLRIASRTLTGYAEKHGFGGTHYESDMAVVAPSARNDFIYTLLHNEDYKPDEANLATSTKQTDYLTKNGEFPFIVVESPHANFFSSEVYDLVAVIGKRCEDPKLCDHPTYRFIVKHLIERCTQTPTPVGCKPEVAKKLVDDLFDPGSLNDYADPKLSSILRGFMLEMNILLPLDYPLSTLETLRLDPNPIQVKVVSAPPNIVAELSRDVGYFNKVHRSVLYSQDGEQHYEYRNMLFGRLTDKLRDPKAGLAPAESKYQVPPVTQVSDGAWIEITLRMPQLKTRKILTQVKPGMSTFVEAQLSYDR